jgi:hypothetical protein
MAKRHFLAEKTINDQDIRDLVEWLKTDPWLRQGSLVKEFGRGESHVHSRI